MDFEDEVLKDEILLIIRQTSKHKSFITRTEKGDIYDPEVYDPSNYYLQEPLCIRAA